MKQQIEVSIIIPNYNYGNYIGECLNSVINSDFSHSKFEIIIVDDASADDSIKIINKLKKSIDIQTKLIINKINLGQCKSRNIAIKQSQGEFLFFLDSDNYIKSDCISKHYNFLFNNPEYSACYAPIQRFDESTKKNTYIFSNEEYDYNRLKNGNYIDNMSMVRKNDLIEIGLFDENLSGWHDYELWLRFGSKNKKIAFIDGEPLSFYREHNNSISRTRSEIEKDNINNYLINKYGINCLKKENIINKSDSINPIFYTNVKIFWANSEFNFSEKNSISQQIFLNTGEKKICLKIPVLNSKIEYLRFDIGEQIGYLNINNIIVRKNDNLIIWEWNPYDILYKENILLIQDKNWHGRTIQISTNNDPQFVIKLISFYNEADFNNEISIELLLSTLDDNQYNLLNKIITKPLSFYSEQDIIEYKLNLDNLNQEKQNIINEFIITKVEKESIKNENQALLNQINSLEEIIKELTNNTNKIIDDKKEIEKKINEELLKKEQKITDLNSVLKENDDAIILLEKKITAQISINENTNVENENYKITVEELNNKIKILIAEKEKLEKIKIEIDDELKKNISENENNITTINNINIKIKEIITQKEILENNFTTQKIESEKIFAEKEDLKKHIVILNEKINDKQSFLSLIIKKNDDLIKNLNDINNELLTLNKNHQESLKQNKDLINLNDKHLDQIKQYDKETQLLNSSKNELMNQLYNMKIEIMELKNSIINKDEKEEFLKNEINILNQKILEYELKIKEKQYVRNFVNKLFKKSK